MPVSKFSKLYIDPVIGWLLVIVPKKRNMLIEAFPWQVFFFEGKKLFDQDRVDGAEIQRILAKRKPAMRASQTFEEALKFFEFVISAKTRLR